MNQYLYESIPLTKIENSSSRNCQSNTLFFISLIQTFEFWYFNIFCLLKPFQASMSTKENKPRPYHANADTVKGTFLPGIVRASERVSTIRLNFCPKKAKRLILVHTSAYYTGYRFSGI
ncbi:hypothetical protein CDAR_242741 [Caerostris darwini]|uniref:Uncharacterized protein n=1 Tax=Caerostris darwini TaxID=1538125 RepID=A0AAV4TKF7_9ARAC|nr:hypothetical protein CDAR_242741 [Caerostris darwini]